MEERVSPLAMRLQILAQSSGEYVMRGLRGALVMEEKGLVGEI
jgi:hypothetical protein